MNLWKKKTGTNVHTEKPRVPYFIYRHKAENEYNTWDVSVATEPSPLSVEKLSKFNGPGTSFHSRSDLLRALVWAGASDFMPVDGGLQFEDKQKQCHRVGLHFYKHFLKQTLDIFFIFSREPAYLLIIYFLL